MRDEIDPGQIQKEKAKARKLRASQWWRNKLAEGTCHYCGGKFDRELLTMDHVVPLSRGGKSSKGNAVVCCKDCNNKKKYLTPAELVIRDRLKKDVFF
ncbi:MAG: HNH endonuclease [Nitrospinae bacterium]|nr:HNH endonuclease [Nitrospinota bacterium]